VVRGGLCGKLGLGASRVRAPLPQPRRWLFSVGLGGCHGAGYAAVPRGAVRCLSPAVGVVRRWVPV